MSVTYARTDEKRHNQCPSLSDQTNLQGHVNDTHRKADHNDNDDIVDNTTVSKGKTNSRECLGTGGDDKKLLEGKLVSGVLSSVDDVEARNRESLRDGVSSHIGVVLPQRDALGSSTSLGGGK